MYTSQTENELIVSDIADVMQDYVSIQLDIDNTKVKAAALVAQKIDIKRIIGKDNILRCMDITQDSSDADKELRDLIIPPLCYYTYSRCLLMFQGTFSDSGYILESDEVEARNAAKSVSKEMKGIAESMMLDVIEFLEKESPGVEIDEKKLTPRIKVFGGKENRASN